THTTPHVCSHCSLHLLPVFYVNHDDLHSFPTRRSSDLADLDTVLSHPEIDAVVVNTPTAMHKDIIIAAAENKKHIFTDKVLALTVEDCKAIYDVIEANGVELMVSLPRLTDKNYPHA